VAVAHAEATVIILEGPEVPAQSERLFRIMQAGMKPPPSPGHIFWEGAEKTVEEFRRIMVEQRRLIYEFTISRVYGMTWCPLGEHGVCVSTTAPLSLGRFSRSR
jgi:hypothetical protein